MRRVVSFIVPITFPFNISREITRICPYPVASKLTLRLCILIHKNAGIVIIKKKDYTGAGWVRNTYF